MARERLSLLGVEMHALTERDLHELVGEAAAARAERGAGARWVIANHNLHSVYLTHHDAAMRHFYGRARYVHIDGMPLIWMGRLLGHRVTRANRLTSLDWIVPLLATCAANGSRVFLLGSAPDVCARAAEVFRERVPGLELAHHHGYFDAAPGAAEGERVVRAITDFGANVLLVGMGMPRQERWIADHLDRLDVDMVWNLGAFMDYFAGAQPTPPRWMGRLGLEWLHRLASDPRRLARRYLVEPWFVAGLFAAELARRGARQAA